MSERYTKLFSLPENLYSAGSPVLIAAGALLKDNQTGRVLAQLKLENISSKEIAAVKVTVAAFDVSGKELVGVPEFQYLDLSAKRDGTFGQKQAIPLPDAVTRSFDAKCSCVIFSDGTTLDMPTNVQWKPLPVQENLKSRLGKLVAQYRRDTTENARLVPLDYEDLWLCTCGSVNRSGELHCHSCCLERVALMGALDMEVLAKQKAAYDHVEVQKRAEEDRKRAAQIEARNAKIRKNSLVAAVIAAVIIIAVCAATLTTKVLIPSWNYHDAISLMEDGSYEEAIAAFEAMGDYKDAAVKSRECAALKEQAELEAAYQEAVALMEPGETGRAAIAFGKLGDYKDAQELSYSIWTGMNIGEIISAASFHTVGVNADGTVVATGNNYHSQCDVSDWTDIISVSTGSSHTICLKSDGTVVATGYNNDGQCDVADWSNIVAVSANGSHTVGLRIDGTVIAVGQNNSNQCDVSIWKDIVAVSAGKAHTVGLATNKTVVAVGFNRFGQCDVSNWSNISAVSAGSNHTVGLKVDGTVIAAGSNNSGQCDITDWTDIIAIAAGSNHTVGLKADGTVIATGSNDNGQCDVSDWTDIIAIAAGDFHTIGLKADGTVVAVGDNQYGQCDVSGWTDIKAS